MSKFNLAETNQATEYGLSIKDVIYLIRRHLPLISIITAVVLIIAILYTLIAIPTYSSTSMVVVDNKSQSGAVFDFGGQTDLSVMNKMMNEIELLKSRTLSEEVVKSLWESENRNNLYLFDTRTYAPEGIRKPLRGVWDTLFNRNNKKKSYNNDIIIPDTILAVASANIRDNISIVNERGTNVLRISMKSNDPNESALLANTVAEHYQQRDMEWSTGEVVNLRSFLQNQLQTVESELQKVEDSLRQFQEEEQIFELEGNAKQLMDQLGDIETKYKIILAEINIIAERMRFIDSRFSQEEKRLKDQLINSINARLTALRTEIAQTEANLVRNESAYGTNHEAVISLQSKLNRLKKELEEQTNELIESGTSVADPIQYRQALIDTSLYLEARLDFYQSQAREYKKIVDQYTRELNTLPAKSVQFAQLERDRFVLAETYSLLRQKLEEARITEASQLGKIRIIDPAIPSPIKTSPNTLINLSLGLFAGLGLGALIAFIIEQTDNTIKNTSEIERRGIEVIGIIPDISKIRSVTKQKNKKKPIKVEREDRVGRIIDSGDIKRRIMTKEDPRSPIAEAYRSLRTSLTYAVNNDLKSLIVTSPGPGEGKTTTITNLAITFANIGKRTLLVDADLRRPMIHNIFNFKIEPGLTHYLTGFPRNIHPLVKQTEIKNLQVVTAGAMPPDPSVLLSSQRMHEFIKNVEIGWDIILFDAPPAVAVTDASLFAKDISHFILVVKAGGTDRAAFDRALQMLHGADAPITGVVMNAVSQRTSSESFHYYNEYYHYYGADKK